MTASQTLKNQLIAIAMYFSSIFTAGQGVMGLIDLENTSSTWAPAVAVEQGWTQQEQDEFVSWVTGARYMTNASNRYFEAALMCNFMGGMLD